jgi:hypothetical protein
MRHILTALNNAATFVLTSKITTPENNEHLIMHQKPDSLPYE